MSYVNFRDVADGAAISDSRLLPRVRDNNGDGVRTGVEADSRRK